MFRPEVEAFSTIDDLGARAVEIFEEQLRLASSERGRASVALSRPTPTDVFMHLATVEMPPNTHLFQTDERAAEEGSNDRNRTLIERDLPGWVDAATFHPMPVDASSLERGAQRCADELVSVCGRPPRIDLLHLGLGPDGHTASLKPDDPVLDVTDTSVAITKKHDGFARMTLTYPVIDAARLVVFIVIGSEKAEALKRVLDGDQAMPAARLQARNVVVLVDRLAAALL